MVQERICGFGTVLSVRKKLDTQAVESGLEGVGKPLLTLDHRRLLLRSCILYFCVLLLRYLAKNRADGVLAV